MSDPTDDTYVLAIYVSFPVDDDDDDDDQDDNSDDDGE